MNCLRFYGSCKLFFGSKRVGSNNWVPLQIANAPEQLAPEDDEGLSAGKPLGPQGQVQRLERVAAAGRKSG